MWETGTDSKSRYSSSRPKNTRSTVKLQKLSTGEGVHRQKLKIMFGTQHLGRDFVVYITQLRPRHLTLTEAC